MLTLRADVGDYVKWDHVVSALKAVYHKPYRELSSLPIPTHWEKDFSIDFITSLPISTNWKKKTDDSILIIINRLIKMIHYKPVMITINTSSLAELMIEVVMRHHGFLNSILRDRVSFFTSNFFVIIRLFLNNFKTAVNSFLPADRWPERKTK